MLTKIKFILLLISQFFMTAYICFEGTELAIVDILSNLYYLSAIILTTIIIVDFSYKEYSRITVALIFVMLCVFAANLFVMGNYSDTSLINILLLAISFKDIGLKKFIYCDFMARASLFIIAALLYLAGVVGDINEERFLGHLMLWYQHHNILGVQVAMIGIEFLYLMDGKVNGYFAYLASIVLIYFLYTIPVSKTSTIALVVALVLMIIYRLFNNLFDNGVCRFLLRNTFLIFTIMYAVFTYLYSIDTFGWGIGGALNRLFTSRLYLSNMNVKEYGYHLFGNSLVTDGEYYYIIDSGYSRFLLQFGLLATGLVAYLYNRALLRLEKIKDYPLIICVVAMLVHGLMESFYFEYDTNSFLFVISLGLFYFDKKEAKKVSKPILTLVCILLILFANSRHIFEGIYVNEGYKTLLAFYERVKEGKLLSLYDWSLGLGSNILNSYSNNYFSILNLIALLFKKEQVEYVYVCISILRYALFGTFTCLWLKKILKDERQGLILSVILTLSGVFITSFDTQFIDVIVLLPLVLYFIESKKYVLVGIGAIFVFISAYNYVIPFATLIVLYVLIKNVINRANIIVFIKEILIILLSFSFVYFLLLPYKEYILTNYYSNIITTIDEFLSSLVCQFITFEDSNEKIYLAISLVSCIPLILLIKDLRKKIILTAGLIASFVLSLIFKDTYDNKVIIIFVFVLFYGLVQVFNEDNENNNYLVYRISAIVVVAINIALYFGLADEKLTTLTDNIYEILMIISMILLIIFVGKFKTV